jgi:hypothetical protein
VETENHQTQSTYVSKGWSKDGQVDFMFCEYMRRSDVEGENIQQVRVV